MPRKAYISMRIEPHERALFRADAEHYQLDLSRYIVQAVRNWRYLGLPLRTIPAPPVSPWVHPKDRDKPSE